jgi:hypothetical protein
MREEVKDIHRSRKFTAESAEKRIESFESWQAHSLGMRDGRWFSNL